MPTLELPIPVAESQRVYTPGQLAREIRNFERTTQDTLRTVRGPAPLIPDYGAGYPATYGRMYGVYHARLQRGVRDVTLIRSGTRLLEQTGWSRNVTTIQGGLSSEPGQRFADQFCTVAGKIIWTNGRDRARIYDGDIDLPLGYERAPSAPTARGPATTGHPVFANEGGYSHPGKVGSIGEVYADDEGTLLPFTRYYAIQFQDAFGNRSPLSPLGGPVNLRTERTTGYFWTDYTVYPDPNVLFAGKMDPLGLLSVRLDDLTRQFWLEGIPLGPDGTVKRIVYATANAVTQGNALRKMVEIDDNITTSIPDNFPDSTLGEEAVDNIPVPIFSVMSPHLGGLAIAVGSRVYLSEPGFSGTFPKHRYVEPDPQGGDITGLFSWAGSLYAWTETSVYQIIDDAEGLRHRPVPDGSGCMAPGSLKATGLGLLIWLARDGFKAMDGEGNISSISVDHDTLFTTLSVSRFGQAAACWRSKTREYMCAVPRAGQGGNSLILCFDGKGWRRWDWSVYEFAGLMETQDWTRRLLAVGRRTDTGEHNVWILDGEHRDYTPASPGARGTLFRSAWLKPEAFGRKRFSAATIYLGIVETGTHTISCKVYQNYRQDVQIGGTATFKTYSPDLDRIAEDGAVTGTEKRLADVTVGIDKVRYGRMTWKKVQMRLRSAESFSFVLTCDDPGLLHIHAVAFDFTYEDAGELVSQE